MNEYINEAMKLYEENLIEMARVGWVPPTNSQSIEVYIRTNDSGKIPHFHVRKYDKNNNFDWETCIRFESAEYFLHGKYTDVLPKKKIKQALDTMLRTQTQKTQVEHIGKQQSSVGILIIQM